MEGLEGAEIGFRSCRFDGGEDLNIVNRSDEKYPLKKDNCRTFDGVFINRINNTRIVAGKMNFPSSPGFMSKQKNMKNCKYLFPIDLLRVVSRWNSFREE